ncbi:transporter, dicarboxylate/amino acid:cation Na+/H+ symporter family protein [Prevotella sp. oral taxon 306 str. F0472]|uniref:dicarboxylate/amino acid:cation symporter n=1 Tax=Prevotella sp. oral taxon 306 TaxID=712461 RepID=UPI00025BA35E|nr:dicarboxylate/amino acid:cation symporter [Prevotella sp. oral taxon 306]EID33633.1 transporter, dicarboxylate/amino acid:cation Na+/H+ symporter family protein [Prevotella sp. oral taxon 306 str. F0472]
MEKKRRIGLLPRVIIAILLGIALGYFLPAPAVRVFLTFNSIFSQFLGFMIPLIIIGLVTPAIAGIGKGAGKMLLATVVIAYVDTVVAGSLSYGTGSWLFPSMIASTGGSMPHIDKATELAPYFTISIPAMVDVMSGLVFSFIVGLGIAYGGLRTLENVFNEFKHIIEKVIEKAIIPLLPYYIFGVFLNMTHNGQARQVLLVFSQIIIVILVLHVLILIYEFCIAGALTKQNPFRLLWNMLPAYLTALGTSSSAATIPVTLAQTEKAGVRKEVAGFVIPLCATIHLSGSAMKITACALTICLLTGLPHDMGLFIYFILMLSIIMVAAPGVPGGAIMAALAPLASILGFNDEAQALMIALYIAMDSFGTACNVTGDGAIAIAINKLFKKNKL